MTTGTRPASCAASRSHAIAARTRPLRVLDGEPRVAGVSADDLDAVRHGGPAGPVDQANRRAPAAQRVERGEAGGTGTEDDMHAIEGGPPGRYPNPWFHWDPGTGRAGGQSSGLRAIARGSRPANSQPPSVAASGSPARTATRSATGTWLTVVSRLCR